MPKAVKALTQSEIAEAVHATNPDAPASALDKETPLYSPVQIVSLLGVALNDVYSAIRKGQLTNYGSGGRTYVRLEDARAFFKGKEPQIVAAGSIISWNKRTAKHGDGDRSFGQVVNVNLSEAIVYVRIKSVPTQNGTTPDAPVKPTRTVWEFSTDTTKERLERGEIQLEDPRELLNMIAWQLDVQGQTDLAVSLRAWLDSNGLTEDAE